ncbi:MAG: septal ring lytic transglycosylase RlpA family protein [Ignavibacteriota bacterium]
MPTEVAATHLLAQKRLQSFVRVILATLLFWVGSLISLGATVLAQSLPKEQPARTKTSQRHRNHYRSSKEAKQFASPMSGTASWYGHNFHNKKTASGRRFDQDALMAAHRTLPFGTLLKVTNTENGRSCIVEVTDRGPFVKKRIIDVSRGAARELQFADKGTTHVILEVVNRESIDYAHIRKNIAISDVLRTPAMAIQ